MIRAANYSRNCTSFYTKCNRLFSQAQFVKTSFANGIGQILLSDPKRMNALTEAMGWEFLDAIKTMQAAVDKQEIRSVIITGEGAAFSAGGDLDWLRQRSQTSAFENRRIMIQFYNFYLSVRKIGVPTIAAINGPAIGAGMCMTLGCDFRIAASDAKLGFTFVKVCRDGMIFIK